MELTNEFEVKVPVEQAWTVLTDVERIAPCLPGAQLQEIEGDEYRGVVKVKVGPITAQYKGKATFIEKDDTAHKAVLKADGRDTRGAGNANAVITAQLESVEGGTKVSVHTDLTVTGKVAQFGRGVLADVSAKLLDQFVENLETTVLADDAPASEATDDEAPADEAAPEATEEETTAAAVTSPGEKPASSNGSSTATATPSEAAPSTPAPGVRTISQKAADPVDLFQTAGAPVAKRAVPVVAGLVVVFLVWRWLRGRGDR
ncbi:MAG: SRPBCC family protein [Acidimicrobiales bacterium]